MIAGFDADIPQGFWRRVTQYHVPAKWLGVWFGLGVCQVVVSVTSLPVWWMWSAGGSLVVVFAELVFLQWLTWADSQWDSLWGHRDCHPYEAD